MTRRWTRREVLATVGAGLLAGCRGTAPSSAGSDGDGSTPGTGSAGDGAIPYDTSVDHDPTAWREYDADWTAPAGPPSSDGVEPTVLVENLEIPWDIAFAPTGEVFLTERTGTIRRFEAFEGGAGEAVARPDEVIDAGAVDPGSDERNWWVPGGEGGLLGITVHPTYPEPPLVYAYFTVEADGGRENAVHAFDVSADDPAEAAWPVVEGIPGDDIHNGGRIEFGPAGYLWITTGDAGEGDRAQDPGDLGGKVLRVEPDGRPATTNPDLGGNADPRVYTYGHRNPQGISWLPDATPVVTEHGPVNGDEVNVLRPGANYGWPNARDPEEYAGTDYQVPVANAPAWAPSGSVFYTGDAVPEWRNRLLFGGLVGQTIVAVTLAQNGDELPRAGPGHRYDGWYDDEYGAAAVELFEDVLGRVRHVEQGPDGALYAITSNRDARAAAPFPKERDDVLVRIDPVK